MLDARAVCYSKTIFSSDEIAKVIHRLFHFLEDPICGMRACLGFKHSTVEDYYIPLHHSLLHLVVLVKAARRKYGDNFCLSDVSNEGPERTNKLMQDFFQTNSNHHFNSYEADEGHGYREPVGGNMLRNALQDHLHDRFIVQPKVKSSSTNIEQSDTSNHKLLFAQFQSAFNTSNESTAKDYLIVYNTVKSCLDSNDTASITRIFDFFNNDQ